MISGSDDNTVRFTHDTPVIIAGGGDISLAELESLSMQGLPIYAADGAADFLFENGYTPKAIIGDMDSLKNQSEWSNRSALVKLKEQDTTDFEKCLYSIDAPKFFALGFTGRRLDHTLGAVHVLARYLSHKKIFLINEREVAFVITGRLQLKLTQCEGKFFSLLPLHEISFEASSGLKFPLDGLTFETGSLIGSSNEISNNVVELIPSESDQDIPYLVTMDGSLSQQVIKQF